MFKLNNFVKLPNIKDKILKILDLDIVKKAIELKDWGALDMYFRDNYIFYSIRAAIWNAIYEIEPNLLNELDYIPSGFFAYTDVETFRVPSNVTKLGTNAFYKSDLEEITIPTSVKELYEGCLKSKRDVIHIYYPGTYVEWRKIKKDNEWLKGKGESRGASLICSDKIVIVTIGL